MTVFPNPPASDAVARRIVGRLLAHIVGGTLELVDERGVERFGFDDSAAPATVAHPLRARITVNDLRFYARLLRDGSIGLGESYADGWWDADDLTAVLRLAQRSLAPTHAIRDRAIPSRAGSEPTRNATPAMSERTTTSATSCSGAFSTTR